MPTKEELQKILDSKKSIAQMPALSTEEEEIAKLREQIAKADATIRDNQRRAQTFKEDDIFERLQTKHVERGEVYRVDAEPGMFAFVLPSIAKSRHFQQIALKGKLSPDAIEDFVKPCMVWCPGSNEETLELDGEALEGHFERYTLLAPTFCQFAQELASANSKVRGKG